MKTSKHSFIETIRDDCGNLERSSLTTLQVNLGKLCNQACLHCHVEAGPTRREIMDRRIGERIIELLRRSTTITTVDITGGAPELNENFRPIAIAARTKGLHIINRCNLTVLFEPGQEDLAEFLKDNSIHVIASLPCYSKENVEQQRGRGVFQKSIDALRILNSLGFGQPDSKLPLDLVYNPLGPSLPPSQVELQVAYKRELHDLFGITFNNLLTITNVPISRFLHQLQRDNKLEEYMQLLISSFNRDAAVGIMCRSLISVAWTGEIYDCDFNQMIELPLSGRRRTIWDIESFEELADGPIAFGDHCFACTAGAGSSCSGAIT